MRILESTTMLPTRRYKYLCGNFPAKLAERGAANNPPTIMAATSCSGTCCNKRKKVRVLASTTKNSARQTEPITLRGFLALDMRVLVTNDPQPPPAKASISPPAMASQPALRIFPTVCFLNALRKIRTPRHKVYTDNRGRTQ